MSEACDFPLAPNNYVRSKVNDNIFRLEESDEYDPFLPEGDTLWNLRGGVASIMGVWGSKVREGFEPYDPQNPEASEATVAPDREAGYARLAIAIAETDPDLIWRIGWWYQDQLDSHWWRIVERSLLDVRISRSLMLGPDIAVLVMRATVLNSVLPYFLNPASGCEKKPEGA